jgi:hypothetical protein
MAVSAAVSSLMAVPVTQPPRAQLLDISCVKALDPIARNFSVTAAMRPLGPTKRLAMNVRLMERPGSTHTWMTVVAPGLGQWVSPTDPPTLGQRRRDVWYVRHPVADLAAPAAYRFVVVFHWIGAGGKLLAQQTLTSTVCQQPELRPDLTVDQVVVTPAANRNRQVYTTTISNIGATAATQFLVELSDAGTSLEKTVRYLGPHSSRTLTFTAPACDASQPPTVTVDPDNQVDVYSRSQAVAVVSCPAPSGSVNGMSAH